MESEIDDTMGEWDILIIKRLFLNLLVILNNNKIIS
jgi:hypothetical protein